MARLNRVAPPLPPPLNPPFLPPNVPLPSVTFLSSPLPRQTFAQHGKPNAALHDTPQSPTETADQVGCLARKVKPLPQREHCRGHAVLLKKSDGAVVDALRPRPPPKQKFAPRGQPPSKRQPQPLRAVEVVRTGFRWPLDAPKFQKLIQPLLVARRPRHLFVPKPVVRRRTFAVDAV